MARESMGSPVRCTFCGSVYDLQAVEVIARFADCSTYKTPCCEHDADDREFVSRPAFTRVEGEARSRLPRVIDVYGRPVRWVT